MKIIKNTAGSCLACFLCFSTVLHAQEYLDANKRYMKLTEVSTDESYGYNKKNPVKVGANDAAMYAYMNSLKTKDGGKVRYIEVRQNDGSISIVLNDKHKRIFFSTTEFEQPKALAGFLYRKKEDIPKVIEYPKDSIKKINSCANKIYTGEELYPRELSNDASVTRMPPTYKNGMDGLEEYFFNAALKNKIDATEIFKGSIYFLVNCEGKAGNFKIGTLGNSEEETIANQVLAIANHMPLDWNAGKMDGKAVDCVQMLWYTVVDGKIINVIIR